MALYRCCYYYYYYMCNEINKIIYQTYILACDMKLVLNPKPKAPNQWNPMSAGLSAWKYIMYANQWKTHPGIRRFHTTASSSSNQKSAPKLKVQKIPRCSQLKVNHEIEGSVCSCAIHLYWLEKKRRIQCSLTALKSGTIRLYLRQPFIVTNVSRLKV